MTANGAHRNGESRDRVFLTGATGFVGAHIQRELLAAGYTVRALVRPVSAARGDQHCHPERSEQSERSRRTTDAVTLITGDPQRATAHSENERATARLENERATARVESDCADAHSENERATARFEESGAQHCHPERRGEAPESKDAVEYITGDLERPGDLVAALRDCRYLIHCAALYSFAPRDREASYRVNVTGTAGIMEAAYLAGVERAVLTSSSATLGHAHRDRPADERDYALEDPSDAYHHSKLLQERAAFASRLPVVAVLPTAPVGPGDWKPTPTGKMILDYARGKMFAKPPGHGGMNLVAVEDVAKAHVAALERGRIGERYVVGGENLSMDAIWEALAELTGVPAPKQRAPYALALAVAYADNLRCTVDAKATPLAPLEGVRMSRDLMFANDAKARAELGHTPTPIPAALERAVAWYRSSGYFAERSVSFVGSPRVG